MPMPTSNEEYKSSLCLPTSSSLRPRLIDNPGAVLSWAQAISLVNNVNTTERCP